jgi:chromosome segregation ATPase
MRGSEVSRLLWTGVVAGLAVAACGGTARAQGLEDQLRSQLVAVTGQLRAAQAQQSDLTARATAAEKDRDALKAQLSKVQAQLAAAKRKASGVSPAQLKAAQADADQAKSQASTAQTQLTASQAQLQSLTAEVDRMKAEHDRATASLSTSETSLAACKLKNAQAIAVGKDILAAYSRITVADVLARKEPLTGLKRVRFEQLEQDYGDRLYDSRLDAKPRKPASQSGAKPK